MKLEEYTYDIQYKPGSYNQNAGGLSIIQINVTLKGPANDTDFPDNNQKRTIAD